MRQALLENLGDGKLLGVNDRLPVLALGGPLLR